MKTAIELHMDHTELSSEIAFLKKEIDFLLKLLRNGYSISVNIEKIKLLDGYWKGFEESIGHLNVLLSRVNHEEKELAELYKSDLIDENKTCFKENDILKEFRNICKSVNILKESFYEYMSGCCACSFKKN